MLDLILKKVCGLVGFCGPEHAFLHRPEQFCFPFMVEMREGVGRFDCYHIFDSMCVEMEMTIIIDGNLYEGVSVTSMRRRTLSVKNHQ